MKIVLVADTFTPQRNSAAVQLRDLSREFVRQGHDLTVLLPDAGLASFWHIENMDGVTVVRLLAPRTKDVTYARRTIAEWLMPHAMRHALMRSPLAHVLWDGVVWYSPSIFHGPLVRHLKRQSECRGYLVIRDIFPEWAADLGLIRPGPVYCFFKNIAQTQYEAADVIGVQSTGNLGYFDRWREQVPARRVEVLPNWLGPLARKRCSIRLNETHLVGRKILVYAGNMGVAQGMDIIVDLAERMQYRNDIGFLFVGRGSDVSRLRERASAFDNVIFHDEIDPDEVPDLYAQCHAGIIALNPSHRSHNIPGKFISYMQSGLPVLANINAGNDLAEMIRQNRVGEVSETNRIDDLVNRCEALLSRFVTCDDIRDRCKSVFNKEFSVLAATRQIAGALQPKVSK